MPLPIYKILLVIIKSKITDTHVFVILKWYWRRAVIQSRNMLTYKVNLATKHDEPQSGKSVNNNNNNNNNNFFFLFLVTYKQSRPTAILQLKFKSASCSAVKNYSGITRNIGRSYLFSRGQQRQHRIICTGQVEAHTYIRARSTLGILGHQEYIVPRDEENIGRYLSYVICSAVFFLNSSSSSH